MDGDRPCGTAYFQSRWKMGEHSARNALAGLRDNQTAAPLAHGRRANKSSERKLKVVNLELPPPDIPGACGRLNRIKWQPIGSVVCADLTNPRWPLHHFAKVAWSTLW